MRERQFQALFIHGVGQQEADFADEARHNLKEACLKADRILLSAAVHWAPLADRVQRSFLESVEKHGSKGNMTQKLVVGTLADALMYQSNPQLRKQIFSLVDAQLARLRGPEVTVFAHSLGGLIFTDYLRRRDPKQRIRLVTFGCNIGLFNLGRPFVPVPQVARAGGWLNCFSQRDMLGFPVNLGDPALKHVRDVEVSVGGWFKGWTGLAHIRYWADSKFFGRTLPELLDL